MFTETRAREAEAKKHVSRGEFFVPNLRPHSVEHCSLRSQTPCVGSWFSGPGLCLISWMETE